MELKTNKTVTIKVNDDNKNICGEDCNYINAGRFYCYCNVIDTEKVKILKEDYNAIGYYRHSECIKMFGV